MNNIASYVYDYALRLGMSPSVSGFDMFAQAVIAYVSSQEFPRLEDVCTEIGKRNSVQSGTVMHAISYIIKSTKNLRENLRELTGIKVDVDDIRPKHVICLVARSIRQDLEDLA